MDHWTAKFSTLSSHLYNSLLESIHSKLTPQLINMTLHFTFDLNGCTFGGRYAFIGEILDLYFENPTCCFCFHLHSFMLFSSRGCAEFSWLVFFCLSALQSPPFSSPPPPQTSSPSDLLPLLLQAVCSVLPVRELERHSGNAQDFNSKLCFCFGPSFPSR